MKKRLWILFVVVVVIVVAHALAMRQCSPVKVTVVQQNVVDTVFAIDSTYKPKSKPARKIELNGADSLSLIRVYGIGPVLSHRILDYRQRLGGFYSTSQLLEIKGLTTQLLQNFIVDSCKIQKINVNFASRKELEAHPYISSSMAYRMEKSKMKGGYFYNYRELINQNILLPKEAKRIAPYLSFSNN